LSIRFLTATLDPPSVHACSFSSYFVTHIHTIHCGSSDCCGSESASWSIRRPHTSVVWSICWWSAVVSRWHPTSRVQTPRADSQRAVSHRQQRQKTIFLASRTVHFRWT